MGFLKDNPNLRKQETPEPPQNSTVGGFPFGGFMLCISEMIRLGLIQDNKKKERKLAQ